MQSADAIVVGGGPAGSTCAWKLGAAGLDVLVIDKAVFPRHKLCAGWVTPEVMTNLALAADDYPLSLMTFERLHLHYKLLTAKPATRQHSIRRFEFDDFLLRRSGVPVVQHKAGKIRRERGDFVIDDTYRCKYLIGAGGTACPVYRSIFQARKPRNRALQTATLEQEFAYPWDNGECHLWFFDDGLPGYAWYVPKAGGYLNIGLGGMAETLKQQRGHVQEYWRDFVARLHKKGMLRTSELHPSGYSYYLRGNDGPVADDNAYLVGDAAGLATHDLCEGIGPAVQSGLLAAAAIIGGTKYSLASVGNLSSAGIVSRLLQRRFTGA